MTRRRSAAAGLPILVLLVLTSASGCVSSRHRYFETSASTMSVPDSIAAGENLRIILHGEFPYGKTFGPDVVHIDQEVGPDFVRLTLIAEESTGNLYLDILTPWTDTTFVPDLDAGSYEVKVPGAADTLRDTVVVH